LDLKSASKDKDDKLLALEVNHLKRSNRMEVEKIEELKQDIEKAKNTQFYVNKEISEIQEKVKNIIVEAKLNELEFSIKKNDLAEKISKLKQEISNEKLTGKSEIALLNKVIYF